MKKRAVYLICGFICLAAAVFCGVKVFQSVYAPRAIRTEAFRPDPAGKESNSRDGEENCRSLSAGAGHTRAGGLSLRMARSAVRVREREELPETEPEDGDAVREERGDTEEPEAEPYVSPVDFEGLQEINPDIYGWLEIEDTVISYPIVQNPEDDTLYLDHNSDLEYSANGAIFSEASYNEGDLSDPVTILYGHHMKSGEMFGNLQKYYTDREFFEEHPTFTIYTPEEELTYGVFAAVPYPSEHILYYHDFTDEYAFIGFFDDIMSIRDLSARFNEEYAPEPEDQVVILSTCLIGNNTNRFLVMGTLLRDDQSDRGEILEERR